MESPIVSIDVSNGNSHYMCFIKNNKRFGKVKKIDHDIEGFKRLLEDIQKLEAETNEKVCSVFEATGVYTKPLERFLSKNSIKTYIINPLESARKRKEEIHNKKTDKLDPISISKVYYDKEEMMELKKKDETHNWLRKKNRLYEDQLNHLRKYKVTFQNQLSICFPGYLDLFKDGYSDIPMTILKKYPHPDLLKNKKAETVARYLEKNTCHTHKVSLEYALKIIEFAKKTYPGCEKDDVEVEIFKILLDKVIETQRECEKTLNEMITVASTLEEYRYISSIDGIGPNLAARIIAEIGDIEEFKSREALVAYAGLDPHIYQSGDQDGKHLKISKKGNKYLRCLLFLAVGCSIRGAKDNPVNRFYQKKKQQSNPLNSKAAKTACTAKLLKIIYGICKNKTTYER